MKGKIVLEEAVTLPQLAYQAAFHAPQGREDELVQDLLDIHNQRLQRMDKYGVEYMVLSVTSPGAQGFGDKAESEAFATEANDYLAKEFKKNPKRFGALCALSMHDPAQAAKELKRAVTELGFLGVILNDFQTVSNPGKEDSFKMYDQVEYDVFWKQVQDLECPVYIHPRMPDSTVEKLLYEGRKGVIGSPWSFATGVSLHTLGLCCNGIFDRFPKVQVVIGHLGERIPYDIWRLDSRLERLQRHRGVTGEKTIRYYMTHNVHITTSGHFNTPSLKCALSEMGADRIMYAIDYPYEDFEPGAVWFDGLTDEDVPENERIAIARGNAIKLFKLEKIVGQ